MLEMQCGWSSGTLDVIALLTFSPRTVAHHVHVQRLSPVHDHRPLPFAAILSTYIFIFAHAFQDPRDSSSRVERAPRLKGKVDNDNVLI